MSPVFFDEMSNSLSWPVFSVTSRRPSGRKVIAQGSSNVAKGVAVNGLPGDRSAALAGSAVVCAGCSAPDVESALAAVPLQATSTRARQVFRGAMRMAISEGRQAGVVNKPVQARRDAAQHGGLLTCEVSSPGAPHVQHLPDDSVHDPPGSRLYAHLA